MAETMTEQQPVAEPSRTAELAAAVRAGEYLYNPKPLYRDGLAVHFAGGWRKVLASRVMFWLVRKVIMARVARTSPEIVVRAVFCEEHVAHAMEAGVRQYVLLGAGYDTFSLRRADLLDTLRVYELDLAATQQEKFRRMRPAGLEKPRNTRYVETDLSRETVADALSRSDFDFAAPAVFSWFGVTYYLTHADIEKTLREIAGRAAPGSYVMFDYQSEAECTPPEWRNVHERTVAFVAKRGEPWLSAFHPDRIASQLQELGYTDIDHVAPAHINERFPPSQKDRSCPPFLGLIRAVTPAA